MGLRLVYLVKIDVDLFDGLVDCTVDCIVSVVRHLIKVIVQFNVV